MIYKVKDRDIIVIKSKLSSDQVLVGNIIWSYDDEFNVGDSIYSGYDSYENITEKFNEILTNI